VPPVPTRPRPAGARIAAAGASITRADWLILLPVLCPAILLLAGNDAFAFDPPGFLDSFIYLGYFWHYPEHLWVFDHNSNYKISRLPWVLPGAAAHALLSPVPAALVLAYVTLTGAAVALYLQIRDALRDRYAAAALGVMLACCTGMHAPGGWYYQALPAATYYLWSCWLLTRAAISSRRSAGWAFAAGASFAAAVHTHVFLIVFAPLLALLYWGVLCAAGERRPPRWGSMVASVTAGAVGLTVMLAAFNRATGGEFLFFLPQFELSFKLADTDPWWLPAKQWLPGATYLVLPFAFTLIGLAGVPGPWKGERRLAATLVALPCLATVITCVFQFWSRVTTLDYDYMAFVLYLHAFPAAAVALRRLDPDRRRVGAVFGVAAVILASLLFLMPTELPAAMTALVRHVGLAGSARIVPPLLLGVAGAAAVAITPRRFRLPIVAVWFAIMNAWTAPQPSAYGVHTPGSRQAMLQTFRDVDDFTERLDPTLIGIKFWLSSETLNTAEGPLESQQVFDSLLATRGWLTNLFGRSSPGLPIETLTIQHLSRATCVGILSSPARQAALARAMSEHYAALDRPLGIVANQQFVRGDLAVALTVLKPLDAKAHPLTAAPCLAPEPEP
jgi:hypothetical protein